MSFISHPVLNIIVVGFHHKKGCQVSVGVMSYAFRKSIMYFSIILNNELAVNIFYGVSPFGGCVYHNKQDFYVCHVAIEHGFRVMFFFLIF